MSLLSSRPHHHQHQEHHHHLLKKHPRQFTPNCPNDDEADAADDDDKHTNQHFCRSPGHEPLVVQSGLVAGGKDSKEGRQAVLFTAVDLMNEPQRDGPHDVKKPRTVTYETKWKACQNALYWINLKRAQDRGFYIMANDFLKLKT